MSSWLGKVFRGDERGRGDLPLDDPTRPPLPEVDRYLPGGERRGYRVMRTAGAVDPRSGKRVFRSGVGVSFLSQAQAEAEARDQAQRAVDDALAGREPGRGGYAYQADRRLEPLVESIRGPMGEIARITVNGYGALVMNAKEAMFVDVDTDEERPDPQDLEVPAALREFASRRADLGFRVYRTLAGWRYLCTTATFDPASDEVRTLLGELGADEKYVLLCRVQRSFRARLTPKAWRAGQRPLFVGSDGIERAKVQRYVDKTWDYATARFMTAIGAQSITPDVAPIVEYHDAWTQAIAAKRLA